MPSKRKSAGVAEAVRRDTAAAPETPTGASGLYEFTEALAIETGVIDITEGSSVLPATREKLRLDVDGMYPQFAASGTIDMRLGRIHWIAELTADGDNAWDGNIWYRRGSTEMFPYTTVRIERDDETAIPTASVSLSGGGGIVRHSVLAFRRNSFHPVNFEFDMQEGEAPNTSIDTHAHPNHPATLPAEDLSIQNVFERAGFNVITSPPGTVDMVGADAAWSNQEMHDAMQIYWSRFADRARWAMWVFFAAQHEDGSSLGGIMFDSIGRNHRQGTAIFTDSFISRPPNNEQQKEAWIKRMTFWTACHEMGHGFNLAHSWQKSLGDRWIPIPDEPEARSFMNYPYNVAGGDRAFFRDFEYRFSDPELLFMRHAPAGFVQMGNADWFDDHGFEAANEPEDPDLELEVRANRSAPVFEFMEPVVLELKLTNISKEPLQLPAHVLASSDHLTVILKKDGKVARSFAPFDRICWEPSTEALAPGDSFYEELDVSAGLNGWDIAEPGRYTVQVALHVDDVDIVSAPLRVKVVPPMGRDEEAIAQDVFTEDVGRVLTFNGSDVLKDANVALQHVVERLPGKRVAVHAKAALGAPARRNYKWLDVDGKGRLKVRVRGADPATATTLLISALVDQGAVAIETFGHVAYKRKVDRMAKWLYDIGETAEAARVQRAGEATMSKRVVNGRKIRPEVIDDARKRRRVYEGRD
ncbi:MAG: hypothetical protein ACRDKT_00465 [Actinomycetota bacterium]